MPRRLPADVWFWRDLANMIDASLPAPGKRGSYKKSNEQNSN
jgi:hypothetical protein